ncbi:MAG: biotin--[acetyl-CoA-carboxylase] ligase [Phycisphaerae bacterium]|nr:MAG: biotin--[acetyl-CoA-carboxylase] ligase [Phycisphaerae bacterium]
MSEAAALEHHLRTLLASVEVARRVVVLEACASTQDEAAARAAGQPGLMVLALRQTAGRGRLGRAWAHSEQGLAATFALPGEIASARLSMAAGLAALHACAASIPEPAGLGLRWPNDVVQRDAIARKVAGVLIERRDGVALAGFGINVRQAAADFPTDLAARACSLAMLGSASGVADVAVVLALCLRDALAYSDETLRRVWQSHDVLLGRDATFEHHGARVSGHVEAIDPTGAIRMRLPDGEKRDLPAETTSLVLD